MTDTKLASYLAALGQASLTFQRGIEREGLRVDQAGNLARTPHPTNFGSKLCHPLITTDFSESQLELITPVATDLNDTWQTLEDVHRAITAGLEDEILWAASMPCVLQGDPTIPLANYGNSNLGKLKRTYRNGLGNRYGRSMQTICAVHYNFSFPDSFWQTLAGVEGETDSQNYRNRRYFDLMRNFRRLAWLPIYLFGASPAVCNSFVKGRQHDLQTFDEGSLYQPFATSLRSGNLGYQSDAQAQNLSVSYNDLNSYVHSLASAVLTPYRPYRDIGVKQDDEYHQLNDSILQSEAEFYSSIRAKRVAPAGANFLQCLGEQGVEYIEVRLLDLDPFEPIGVSQDTVRFLDTFLLYCLLEPSPRHDDARLAEVRTNMNIAVHEGRRPNVKLMDGDKDRELSSWAADILAAMQPIAFHFDKVHQGEQFSASLAVQGAKVADAGKTPSARILATMSDEQIPYFRFAMNQSLAHRAYFAERGMSPELEAKFQQLAQQSVVEQTAIDSKQEPPFADYLANIMQGYQALV
jgi:glutamate--cysteine ligase